jgi:hypothetical protein
MLLLAIPLAICTTVYNFDLVTDGTNELMQKTLDFARGCNSIQNQLVNFSYFSSLGTGEVGGSNPLAPTIRINYLRCQHWRPYFICGQFADTCECVITYDNQPRTKVA